VGSVDPSVYVVKFGRSTKECYDPNAVISVNEGQSTSPEQIRAIFGQSEPSFSTANPLAIQAIAGFHGYIRGRAELQYCHGFALVTGLRQHDRGGRLCRFSHSMNRSRLTPVV
jgi:hypothetical protein